MDSGEETAQAASWPSVDGNYWVSGVVVAFGPGKHGPQSEITSELSLPFGAKLESQGSEYVWTSPDCQLTKLKRGGSHGQFLTAQNVDCQLTADQLRGGVKSLRVVSLEVDLDKKRFHRSACLDNAYSFACERWDGAINLIPSSGSPPAVTYEDTAKSWLLGLNNQSRGLVCDLLNESASACVPGDGRTGHINISSGGRLHQLKDGRYYLEGLDCYAPTANTEEAIRCGSSYDGKPDLGVPELWLTKFQLESNRLKYVGEVRGKDFKYYIAREAALTLQ